MRMLSRPRGLIAALAAVTALGAGGALAGASAAKTVKHKAGGDVYVMTNLPTGNAVVVFHRYANGFLKRKGTYPTGGTGGGGRTTLPVPIADSQDSLHVTADRRFLFAVNIGSNTITSFRIHGDKLKRVSTVSSRGQTPTSLYGENGLLYVTNVKSASIAGFHYNAKGRLRFIHGSVVQLKKNSEPSAEIFDFHQRFLIVNERDHNTIVRIRLKKNGAPGKLTRFRSAGTAPFGLNMTSREVIVTADAGGFPLSFGDSSISSYNGKKNPPKRISHKPNKQTSSCWIIFTGNERYGFTSSAISESITTWKISKRGKIRITRDVAEHTNGAAADEDRSSNSKYLYVLVLNVNFMTLDFKNAHIEIYRIGRHGGLKKLGSTGATLPGSTSGLQSF